MSSQSTDNSPDNPREAASIENAIFVATLPDDSIVVEGDERKEEWIHVKEGMEMVDIGEML